MWIRLPLARLSSKWMDFRTDDAPNDAVIIYLAFGDRWIPAAIRSVDVGVLWDEESLEYNKLLDIWMIRPIRADAMHSINIHMIECDDVITERRGTPPLLYAHCGADVLPDSLIGCMEAIALSRRSQWSWRQAAPYINQMVMRIITELPRCCDWVVPWDIMRPDPPVAPDPEIVSKFLTEAFYTDPEFFRTSTRMVDFWTSNEGRLVWSMTAPETRKLITKNMLFYIPRIPSLKDLSIRGALPNNCVPRLEDGQPFSVFNPCIFDIDGIRRICIRTSNYDINTYRSRDGGAVITRNFIISKDGGVVELDPSYPMMKDAVVRGLEDVRFYPIPAPDGCLMFLANCCDFNGSGGMPVVVWGAMDPISGKARIVHLDYGCCKVEKNWMPMIIGSGNIMAVYSVDPLIILDLDGIIDHATDRFTPQVRIFSRTSIRRDGPLDCAPIRGSGALIDNKDGWYIGVIHQVLWTHKGQRKYYHRLIRIHPESGSVVVGIPWVIHGCRIEYVLSLVREKDHLIIAYSCMDEDARVITVPAQSPFIPLATINNNTEDPMTGWPGHTLWINRDCDINRRTAFEARFSRIPSVLHRISAEDGDASNFAGSWPACAFIGNVHTADGGHHQNMRTLALTLSHLKALDVAYHMSKDEWVLILEDDACLENIRFWPTTFGTMISSIPSDTNLVLMSPLFPLKDLVNVSMASYFCPLKPYGTTLAYIIRRNAIPETVRTIMGRFPRTPLGVSDMEIYGACPGRSLMTCMPWFTFPDDNTSTIHDQHAKFQMECKTAFNKAHFRSKIIAS